MQALISLGCSAKIGLGEQPAIYWSGKPVLFQRIPMSGVIVKGISAEKWNSQEEQVPRWTRCATVDKTG